MQVTFHPEASRGKGDFGWLKTAHTFSFGHYHNPERMGFGALRVLNDDWVAPGGGFAPHSHANMEIVSIPLQGQLRHEDSTGEHHLMSVGDIQRMSAGKGITHSEYNGSDGEAVNFLQIWVLPHRLDIAPSYEQKHFADAHFLNQFALIVSPSRQQASLAINQNAFFSIARFTRPQEFSLKLRQATHGLYLFVIAGDVQIAGQGLGKRDGIAISDCNELHGQAGADSHILAIEIPLES